MTNSEIIAAAKALIGWFNATDTKPSEARAIMRKVQAKLIAKNTLDHSTRSLVDALNEETTLLANDINERLLQISRGK